MRGTKARASTYVDEFPAMLLLVFYRFFSASLLATFLAHSEEGAFNLRVGNVRIPSRGDKEKPSGNTRKTALVVVLFIWILCYDTS